MKPSRTIPAALAALDVVLAVLLHRRSRLPEPLFGPSDEMYAQWAVGVVGVYAAAQGAVALRPSPSGSRQVALMRALLVPGDLGVFVRASGRRRWLYAGAGAVNGSAAFLLWRDAQRH